MTNSKFKLIHMPQKGLFITLYDKETLQLYLNKGIYGQLMSPEKDVPSHQSVYFPTMADYACCRDGDHVFFFLKREIYYGGQISGSNDIGSFFLNGTNGPIGRKANAPLVWDESVRDRYSETEEKGVFIVNEKPKCQHFLIRFNDRLDLVGNYVISDSFYLELGRFPFPLPANSISGMGFCVITPGETQILLALMSNDSEGRIENTNDEDIEISKGPTPYNTQHTNGNLNEIMYESELEASIIANPKILPGELHPQESAICRQVPISPFKSFQLDRADICYYGRENFAEGTIPNTVIELKKQQAGKKEAIQLVRYMKWHSKLKERFNIETEDVKYYLFAPNFTGNITSHIPNKFKKKIDFIEFNSIMKQSTMDSFVEKKY